MLEILVTILDQFVSIRRLDTSACVIMVIQAKELHVSTLMNVSRTRAMRMLPARTWMAAIAAFVMKD